MTHCSTSTSPSYPTGQDNNLNIFYNDHPFNWAVSFALYCLGDPGVIGDVFSLRSSYGHLKALKHKNDTLAHLIANLQQEQEWHNEEIKKFTDDTVGVQSHLVTT